MKTMKGIQSIKAGITAGMTSARGELERIVSRLHSIHSRESQRGNVAVGFLAAIGAAVVIGTCVASYDGSGNDFPEYHLNAPVGVGSENVLFYEPKGLDHSVLLVKRPDEGVVAYVLGEQAGHKLQLREVRVVTAGGQKTSYYANSPNEGIRGVITAAEQDVGRYLDAIVTAKTAMYNSAQAPAQK